MPHDKTSTAPPDEAPTDVSEGEGNPATVLVVDDEPANVTSLKKIFEREGHTVLTAEGGRTALDLCRQHTVDVVVSDLMMPQMNGIDLLRAVHTLSPDIQFVMMTAYGTVETAVEAMRQGAYDFVEKPLKRMQIVKSVRKAAERGRLLHENRALKKELSALKSRTIVGASTALRGALHVGKQAAPSTANVLILGESGTGKELVARYIHEHSERTGPFVAVNLSALPESVLEGELFGHERGAFTGAVGKREGRIAQAEGGTLFLDEIGELTPQVQVKLLRVLQEGEYEPLGGKTQKANFRLVAATNRDLKAACDAGEFREDLFYRLNVIAITCPPLRDRRDDVPLLADHFVELYCRKNGKARLAMDKAALDRLERYDWPGNVRELENVLERAVVLCAGDRIKEQDLPPQVAEAAGSATPNVFSFALGTPLAEVEQRIIRQTLDHTKGDKQLAAQLLGISARTIYRKLAEDEPK